MSLIEQIGAYAGLAAIPGLAILSALYFSQARDVRRLREWAGRAPERAAEQASGGRVAVQPGAAAQPAAAQPAVAQPDQAATAEPAGAPVAQPAKAGAAAAVAAGAGSAVAAGASPAATGAATPAGATASAAGTATPAKEEETAAAAAGDGGNSGGTGTVTKPATAGGAKPAGAGAAVAGATGGAKPATPAAAGGAKPPAVGAKPAATGARPTVTTAPGIRRPGAPRIPSQQTSILKPTSTTPPREPWYRRLPAARYLALIVAGVLVVGGGAAFGITQLAKEEPGGSSKNEAAAPDDGNAPDEDKPPALKPENITVTVLNGTQINGLARDTAAELERLGFMIANKLTATQTAQAESVVQFKPGASREAQYVGAKLDIAQIEPADEDSLAQAGSATVIVVLGADQAPTQ